MRLFLFLFARLSSGVASDAVIADPYLEDFLVVPEGDRLLTVPGGDRFIQVVR